MRMQPLVADPTRMPAIADVVEDPRSLAAAANSAEIAS